MLTQDSMILDKCTDFSTSTSFEKQFKRLKMFMSVLWFLFKASRARIFTALFATVVRYWIQIFWRLNVAPASFWLKLKTKKRTSKILKSTWKSFRNSLLNRRLAPLPQILKTQAYIYSAGRIPAWRREENWNKVSYLRTSFTPSTKIPTSCCPASILRQWLGRATSSSLLSTHSIFSNKLSNICRCCWSW